MTHPPRTTRDKRAPTEELSALLRDARERTFELIDDLDEDQLLGPQYDIVNPPLWEIGHLAWFHERWGLRDLDGDNPLREDADELYDSIAINHDTRWDLPLPSYDETRDYMRGVLEALESRLEGREPTEHETYRYRYTTFHEDMHTEAFTYTRQTLGYVPPNFSGPESLDTEDLEGGSLDGDVAIPGGTFLLGTPADEPFAFDNERQAHEVTIEPFEIARAPVTNREFAEFVEDGGYDNPDLWSDAGWTWRREAEADAPDHWRWTGERWRQRLFDEEVPLNPDAPVVHVNWWEARAWCQWAGRRLPTEAEWEAAAAGAPDGQGGLADTKRRYPWGDEPPTAELALADGTPLVADADLPHGRVLADVGAFPEGDSAFGCRQMFGNVWEWTASTFEAYPGFEADMYGDYSEPWFGDRKVLRGGAWATRSRMIHNMWRNYFTPERRDVYAGFRTCPRK